MSRGDELIANLCSEGTAGAAADVAAVELLGELSAGYPVEKLIALFHAGRPAATKAGAWLASELGEHALPLLDEVAALLSNDARYVRFFAIDAVLVAATPDHGRIIAKAIELIDDPDDAVRWKAMQLLARATVAQLAAAVPYLRDENVRVLTTWINNAPAAAEISSRLTASDRATRMFAAAAAARLSHQDTSTLEQAATVPDSEISTFAREQLDLLSIRRRRR